MIYVAFAVSAVRVLAGAGGSSRGERHAVGGMLSWPGGPELVGAIGVGFLVVGAVNVYWGLSGRFEESLDLEGAPAERERRTRSRSGRRRGGS